MEQEDREVAYNRKSKEDKRKQEDRETTSLQWEDKKNRRNKSTEKQSTVRIDKS